MGPSATAGHVFFTSPNLRERWSGFLFERVTMLGAFVISKTLNRVTTLFLAPPLWWRFIRVRQWYYFAVLPLACAAQESLLRPGKLFFCFALAAGSLAFAYGLNSITDAATDRDELKNPLAGGRGVPQQIQAALWILPLAVLGAACWLGSLTVVMVTTSLLAGWLYSGAIRLKRLPVAGLLCNHAIFVPLLYLGGTWALFDSTTHLSMVVGCLALLTQNQLVHELMDVHEDVEAGDKTTAQMLEKRGTFLACYLVGFASAFAAFFVLPTPLHLVGALALLVATIAIWIFRHNPELARTAHRWAGLIGSGFYYAATLA